MKKSKQRIIVVIFLIIAFVSLLMSFATALLTKSGIINMISIANASFSTVIILYLSFLLRFRIGKNDYEGYGKYDKKRVDYEEKIRQMQNAINTDVNHWMDNYHLAISAADTFNISNHKYFDVKQVPIRKGMVFMLMPFTDEAFKIYKCCKDVLQKREYELIKSDDEFIEGNLLNHIVKLIIEAELIITNLDGKNPNVYYELGIAHALGKRTILISSYQPKDIPFNLMGNYILFFKNSEDLSSKLTEYLNKISDKRRELTRNKESDIESHSIRVGEYVTFGRYPYESVEKKSEPKAVNPPISWRVLDIKDDGALLITKNLIDCKPYHERDEDVTWQNCSLRSWMNNEFFNSAFNEDEKSRIIEVLNVNQNISKNTIKGGGNTLDRVFALSVDEADKYFKDTIDRRASVTPYAKSKGSRRSSDYQSMEGNGMGWWWLRSPGLEGDLASDVVADGNIVQDGGYVNGNSVSVRPAIWVRL